MFKGTTNTIKAVPIGIIDPKFIFIVGYSVYDYISNLKGIPYPSDEYVAKREEVSSILFELNKHIYR